MTVKELMAQLAHLPSDASVFLLYDGVLRREIDVEQWNELTNRPAIILKTRPNTRLDFRSPPSLPAYLFTLLEFLVKSIDSERAGHG